MKLGNLPPGHDALLFSTSGIGYLYAQSHRHGWTYQGLLLPSHGRFGLVYWGLTPQQQPGSYQGGEMMMMKSVFWWRKPEYPEETTDLQQVTDETFHTYGLCPVRGLNLGRSGVKQSELRRDESGALAQGASGPWGERSRWSVFQLRGGCEPTPVSPQCNLLTTGPPEPPEGESP